MLKYFISLSIPLLAFLLIRAGQDAVSAAEPATNDTTKIDTLRPSPYKLSGKSLTGKAGLYGNVQDTARTVSGEYVNQFSLAAASSRFPVNSWLKVTNPKTRKYVFVRVIDTINSYYRKVGRELVMTRKAASKIGLLKNKNISIKIQQIIAINSKPIDSMELVNDIPSWDTTIWVNENTIRILKTTGQVVKGIASFYSRNLDGTLTATGEIYRNKKLTAASNNFKLNTWVLVTNLSNNKSVVVRINDRMHPRMKRKGRVVDMSGEAANILDYKKAGLTRVKVEPLDVIDSVLQLPVYDTLDSQKSLGLLFPEKGKPERGKEGQKMALKMPKEGYFKLPGLDFSFLLDAK